jgi:ligand-binding sensor protein/putative methionine-R-sulfoxide reductase with GAF domain
MSVERDPFSNKPVLSDLIGSRELQEMQDSFAEVANVSVRTVDPHGRFLTKMSHMPTLCADAIKDSRLAETLCRSCLPTFLGGEGIVDEELSFECLPGLRHYLVPLKVNCSYGKALILGYMIIGPIVFMKRRNREAYVEVAERVGMSVEQLWGLLLELRVFSYKGIRSFIDMVEHLMGRILALSFAKWAMQDAGRLAMPNRIFGRQAGPGAAERLDEFLKLFLDLVMDVTNGNRGSLMLWDPDKQTLSIRASQGIPDEIVAQTQVSSGSGVAGLAFEQKRSFLISGDRSNIEIADRLTQPQIFSSLVVPIKSNDTALGVLNVASDRRMPVQFDDSSLALVTRAAALAAVALQSLQR